MPIRVPLALSSPRSVTADAIEQERQTQQVNDQYAEDQDFIAKQQKEQARIQQAQEAAAADAARAQKAVIANAKRAGAVVAPDATGTEQIQRHEDGQPVYQAGFIGTPQVSDKGGAAKYRDARGSSYDVPFDAIRSETDASGETFYSFDVTGQDGSKQTMRQPAGTKPLFRVDPTTGNRLADMTDPATGSVRTQVVGIDRPTASKAAIAKRRDALQLRQNEISGESAMLSAQQQAKETDLSREKARLKEAQDAWEKIDKSKERFEKTEEGLFAVSSLGEGVEPMRRKVEAPAEIAKADSWLKTKAAAESALAAVKATHDPLDAEVFGMQKQRDQLAIRLLEEKRRAEAEIRKMDEAAKAGEPVYMPEWQKQRLSLAANPRVQDIETVAALEDAGDPMAEDVQRATVGATAKRFTELWNAGFTGPQDMTGKGPLQPGQIPSEATREQVGETQASVRLVDGLASGLTAGKPATVADSKAARDIAARSLGMQPDGVDVSEQKPEGHYELSRKGEVFASLDPRNNRLTLLDTPASLQDKGAEIIANASPDGVPVYMVSSEQPFRPAEVRDLIQTGINAARNTKTELEAEQALADVGLDSAGIRQKVMAGKLSVQDGKMLNEKLNNVQQVNATATAVQAEFGKFLTETPILAEKYRNGTREQKAEVVNLYMDGFAAKAGNGVVIDRSLLAQRRAELLAATDERGAISKAAGFTGGAIKSGIASLAGIGYWMLRAPDRAMRLVGGTDDEGTNLVYNQSRDLVQRLAGENAPWNKDSGPMGATLGEVEAWANRADSVDDMPDELADKLAEQAFTNYHGFSAESAADVETSRDTFNVKKNPQLRPMLENYLKTGNGASFQGIYSMLKQNARERQTAAEVQKYIERPRAATPAAIASRASLLGIQLDPAKATAALNLSKQLEEAKDEKQAAAVLKQAATVLGLENPDHAALALSEISREETTDPESWTGMFRGASVAGIEEVATEVVSDVALAALSATVVGAPEAVALKGAQVAAKQGIRGALNKGFQRLVTHNLDNLANRSAKFAQIREVIGKGRTALGNDLRQMGDDFQALGIRQPKFGQALTTGQKAANLAVGTIKATVAGAPIEALEEGLTAVLSNDPSAAAIGDAMLQGAIGVGGITPVFAGVQGIRNAFTARGQSAKWEKVKGDYIAKVNEAMAKNPGFKPLTIADFDAWQGLQESPGHKAATAEWLTAKQAFDAQVNAFTQASRGSPAANRLRAIQSRLAELEKQNGPRERPIKGVVANGMESVRIDTTEEKRLLDEQAKLMDDPTSADSGVTTPSPSLLAAKVALETAHQNLAGLSQVAFEAMAEIRALAESERVLYTAAAKAAAGATDYTEAEAKALMQQSGANAVIFQQAQTLPANVQGPAQLKNLADIPNVTTAAPGVYRLPDGVRLNLPQPLVDMLAQKSPSMVNLMGRGTAPATAQGATSEAATKSTKTTKTPTADATTPAVTPSPTIPPELQAKLKAFDTSTFTMAEIDLVDEVMGDESPFAETFAPQEEEAPYVGLAKELADRLKNWPNFRFTKGKEKEEEELINSLWGVSSPFNVPKSFQKAKIKKDSKDVAEFGQPKYAQALPMGERIDDEVEIQEDEVLFVVENVVAREMDRRNRLAQTRMIRLADYQEHDGGMKADPIDEDILINVTRLARSAWNEANLKGGTITRRDIADHVALTIDHEVVHIAQIKAAHNIFDALTAQERQQQAGTETEPTFWEWVKGHYGRVWREEFTAEEQRAVITAYGSILATKDEWIKAFEAFRMLVQTGSKGRLSEAVLRHLQGVLVILKRWYADLKGDLELRPVIKAEIEGIEAVLADAENPARAFSEEWAAQASDQELSDAQAELAANAAEWAKDEGMSQQTKVGIFNAQGILGREAKKRATPTKQKNERPRDSQGTSDLRPKGTNAGAEEKPSGTGGQISENVGKVGGVAGSSSVTPDREVQPYGAAEVAPKTPKSSTQFTLSPADAKPILDFGASIPKDELFTSIDPEWSDGALETEPHVTVLYGLTKHEAAPVAKAIKDHGPVTVTLGKLSIFENGEYDVLKIDVEGPELRSLNAKLSKLPNENSFPDYKPHMTIAYLKKGEGRKYVGDTRFEGRKFTFDTMTFSPPPELRGEIGKPELPLSKSISPSEKPAQTSNTEGESTSGKPTETVEGSSTTGVPTVANLTPAESIKSAKESSAQIQGTATSNDVRDHPQQAIIKNGTVTIKMKVGNKTAGTYSFPLAEWLAAEKGPSANPNWNRREIIKKYTAKFELDEQDGGPSQADRIRDAQVRAIQKALPTPPPVKAPIPAVGEKTQTIAGLMDLNEFEQKGYAPEQVTRADWVALQRAERRRLGQPEQGDNKNAPWAEYEEFHREAVQRAVDDGETVDPEVLKDYPELDTKADIPATETAPTVGETAPAEMDTPPEPETPPAVQPAKRTKKTISKIEDVGEKIGGARKDRWKERGLAMSDYDGLTDTEKQAYTNKAQVFPKPDYQALIDSGMDKPMAYALKEVYDSIAPKPNLNRAQQADPAQRDAALRLYVDIVGKIRDGLKSVKTPEELSALRSTLFPQEGGGYSRQYTPEAKAAMHLVSTGKRRYELPGAMEVTGYDLRNIARKLEKLPAWPAPQEQWQRMFDIRRIPIGSVLSTKLPDGTWEKTEVTVNTPPVWQVTKDYRILSEHPTQEAAEAWAKAAAVKSRKEDPKRPFNPDVKRTGEDYRKGRDVTGEELLAEFGFRGAEFGLWTNDGDRQQSLNQAFDGLHDLARVLNVPPKALSLNGELGIAFGARGSGKFAAHYEPSRVVINLTKTSGAGALAHEWAHAMDDYFGRMATKGRSGEYASHGAKGTDAFRAELAATINEVMKAISERQWTAPEYIADLKERNASAQKKTDSWLKSVERSTEKVKLTPEQKDEVDAYTMQLRGQRMPEALVNGRPDMTQVATKMLAIIDSAAKAQKIRVDWPVTGGGKMSDLAAGLGRHSGMIFATNNDLARAEAGDLQVPNRTVPTNTLKASQEQGDYWQRKHELFARSFEAFVEDSIRREGNQSPYLVGFTADSGAWGNLYPQGDERAATNEAFQKMVDALKTRETDKGVALFSAPAPTMPRDRAEAILANLEPKEQAGKLNPREREAIDEARMSLASAPAAQNAEPSPGGLSKAEVKTNYGNGFYRAADGDETNNIYITDEKEDAERYLSSERKVRKYKSYWTRKELDLLSMASTFAKIEAASGVPREQYSTFPFEELNRAEVRNGLWGNGYDSVVFWDKHSDNSTDHLSVLIRSSEQFKPQKQNAQSRVENSSDMPGRGPNNFTTSRLGKPVSSGATIEFQAPESGKPPLPALSTPSGRLAVSPHRNDLNLPPAPLRESGGGPQSLDEGDLQLPSRRLALRDNPQSVAAVNPESSRAAGGPLASSPARQSQMLEQAAATLRGEGPPLAPGLRSMFNPQARRPATGERGLFDRPKDQLADSIQKAYRAVQMGQSTVMVPIRAVFQRLKAANPALTVDEYLAAIQAADQRGDVMLEAANTTAEQQANAPFVVPSQSGPGVRMAWMDNRPPQVLASAPSNSPQTPTQKAIYEIRQQLNAADAGRSEYPIPEERLRAQAKSLLQWAASAKRIIDRAELERATTRHAGLGGGEEHDVWHDAGRDRVVKLTKPGAYGIQQDLTRYLDTIEYSNRVFGDDIVIEGVVFKDGWTHILISQPFYRGEMAPQPEIDEYFATSHGAQSTGRQASYLMPDGARVYDAKPRNVFTLTNGSIQPIDVQVALASAPARSVTAAQDAEYMAAVEAGDMETAQRMVDEAAKAAALNGWLPVDDSQGIYLQWNGKNRVAVVQKDRRGADEIGTFDGYITKNNDRPAHFLMFALNPNKQARGIGPLAIRALANMGELMVDSTERDMRVALSKVGATKTGADEFQIKSADPVTRDNAGNVIPLSQRFNPQADSILYSAPSKETAKQKQTREILESMPPIWRDVLQDQWNNKSIEDIAAARNLSLVAVGNILRRSGGLFDVLMKKAAAATPEVAVEDGIVKAVYGRPDLARSGDALMAALDQNRPMPEVVHRAEMEDLAGAMFSGWPTESLAIVKRWMDSGGMMTVPDNLPHGLKVILDEASARGAAPMLMQVAANHALNQARLNNAPLSEQMRLGLAWRELGTEQARAFGARQDTFHDPMERHALYIQKMLTTPQDGDLKTLLNNPASRSRILAEMERRAEDMKRRLKAAGYDLDAWFAEQKAVATEAASFMPPAAAPQLKRLPRKVQHGINAWVAGAKLQDAAREAGMTAQELHDAYADFYAAVNQEALKAAVTAKDEMLRSAPAPNDFAAQIGLPPPPATADPNARLNDTPKARAYQARRENAALNRPTEVAAAMSEMSAGQSGFIGKMAEYWRMSILSGPQTWVVNASSGLALGMYRNMVQKLGTAGLASIVRATGMADLPNAPALSDIGPVLQHAWDSFVPSLKNAFRSWKHNRRLYDAYAKGNLTLDPGGKDWDFDKSGIVMDGKEVVFKGEKYGPALSRDKWWKLGAIMDVISFRMLLIADEFVRSWFGRIETAAQLRQMARSEPALKKRTEELRAEIKKMLPTAWELRYTNNNGYYAVKPAVVDFIVEEGQNRRVEKRTIMERVGAEEWSAAVPAAKRDSLATNAADLALHGGFDALLTDKATPEQLKARLDRLGKPGSGAWMKGVEAANTITAQSELGTGVRAVDAIDGLADLIQRGKTSKYALVSVPMQFLFPFVATPVNLFKTGITMSPVGGFLALIDAVRSYRRRKAGDLEGARKIMDAARALEEIVNQTVAWGLVLTLSELMEPDDDEEDPKKRLPRFTGTGEWKALDAGERQLAYKTAPPLSFRIGDRWFSYRRLDPFAIALANIADGIDAFKKEPTEKALFTVGVRAIDAMEEKTFLAGAADAMNLIRDPERYGPRWAANIATGFIPNLIRQPVRSADEQFRDKDIPANAGFLEKLERHIGYSIIPQFGPEKLDLWGRNVEKDTDTFGPLTDTAFRLLSPVGGSVPAPDALDVALYTFNLENAGKGDFGIEAPERRITRTIAGQKIVVDLTDEERANFIRQAGSRAHATVTAQYGGRKLTLEDVDNIREIVRKVYSVHRDAAFVAAVQKRGGVNSLLANTRK